MSAAEKDPMTPAEAWDAWWREEAANEFRRLIHLAGSAAMVHKGFTLTALTEARAESVLIAGNGLSLLPHALAYVGMNVTEVDFSSFANEFVRTYEVVPEMLASYLHYTPVKNPGRNRLEVRRMVEKEKRPGGLTTFVTEDLLRCEPELPFDAIVDDRTMLVMDRAVWGDLAARYYRWLRPGGFA